MSNIKKTTAIVSMLVLGILGILFSIRGVIIDLTPSTYGFVGLGIGIILLTEIGIKSLTKLSRIKGLPNQQKVSLVIAIFVLITSFQLLFQMEIPLIGTAISSIANGSFLTGGAFVILEALTF